MFSKWFVCFFAMTVRYSFALRKYKPTNGATKFATDNVDAGSAKAIAELEDDDVLVDDSEEEALRPVKRENNTGAPKQCDPDWQDDSHFDCQTYEGAGWCKPTGKPDYGWCLKSKLCDKTTIKKGGYQLKGMQKWGWGGLGYHTTKQAAVVDSCAGCGGDCPATVLEPVNPIEKGCLDYPSANGQIWRGPSGYSCGAYHHGRFCKLTEEGKWVKSGAAQYYDDLETFKNFALKGGKQVQMSPLQACCSCGGGSVCPNGWKQPADSKCEREFVYNKKAYSGCTIADNAGKAWCSHDVHHNRTSSWSECEPC